MRVNKKFIASALIFFNCVLTTSPALAATEDSSSSATLEENLSSEVLPEDENLDAILEVEEGLDTTSEEEPSTETDPVYNPPAAMDPIRLSGATRYETALAISEHYNSETVNNVILTTGNEFADALSASVLAHTKEAPILLVDKTLERSQEAFSYIVNHLDSYGTIYIIGGTNIIGNEFETRLEALGFSNIERIAGTDRYDTSYKLANNLEDSFSTVIISSGEQYPDALSISSFAANKGWPILLSRRNALTEKMKVFLTENQPEKIYITGGVNAISDNIVNEITAILSQTSITRLTGESRFETNIAIAETFTPYPSTVYLATGNGFADALAGSILAAENGEPIIFVSPALQTLPKPVANYFAKLHTENVEPNLVIFGGEGIISPEKVKSSHDLIMGKAKETDIYSVADLSATVDQKASFVLPQRVTARLYNGEAATFPIKWNTPADTSRVGVNVYEGVVNGYNGNVKFTLKVRKPVYKYTTYFNPGEVSRTTNLRLAAEALDQVKIIPGQTFSFNKTVGERTEEAGYQEAYVIEGDEFVLGVGGGICQVSSTLYNAVLLSNLEIVERHTHSLPVAYVPTGKDATVAYGYLDFKFKNNTPYDLMLQSFIKNNALTIQIQEM